MIKNEATVHDFLSTEIRAANGAAVRAPHGILDASAEQTARNIGLIAVPGMVKTERVIVEIMQNK